MEQNDLRLVYEFIYTLLQCVSGGARVAYRCGVEGILHALYVLNHFHTQ